MSGLKNPFVPAEKYSRQVIAITAVFSFIGIAALAAIDSVIDNKLIVASFGSTAVLIYAAPKAPFSKYKNVFFGHIFSAIVSMLIVFLADLAGLMGNMSWIVCGLCVMCAILVMMFTGTIHPPAGATALTIALTYETDPLFLVFPLAIGLLFMIGVAYAAVQLRARYA